MPKLAIALALLLSALTVSHAQNLTTDAPKPGSPAPRLTYTQLLQAPAGAKTDWPSLRGKVVVLEFWATWCAPCIGEIPILNRLAASLDPARVQFIAIDDEDPAKVEAFLKKKPIAGWVMLDTTGDIFKRYGIAARPATIVIGPGGRIVSNTTTPPSLHRETLLALAQGKSVSVEGKADPRAQAEADAATSKAFAEQIGTTAAPANALFDISIAPGDPTQDTHAMMLGPGMLDLTNATPKTLLELGLNIPAARIQTTGLPDKVAYNLHLKAPNVDQKKLQQAVEVAIASAAGLHIEHVSAVEDVYLLQPLDPAKGMRNASNSPITGGAFYSDKSGQLQIMSGDAAQIASALEQAIGTPVLSEAPINGKANTSLKIPPRDLAAAKAALEASLGLTLVPARRPVDRLIVTATPKPATPPETAAAK